MARKKAEVTLDGHRYTISQMGGMDAFRAQALLFKALGEPIAKIVSKVDSLDDLLNLDTEEEGDLLKDLVETAVPALAKTLDPEDLVKLARLLVVGNVTASVGGTEILIEGIDEFEDIIGARGPWHQLRLLQNCVTVNFLPRGAGADTSPSSQEDPTPAGSAE